MWQNCLLVGRGIFINSQEKNISVLVLTVCNRAGQYNLKKKGRVLAILAKQYNYWEEKALAMWKRYNKKYKKITDFFPNRKAVHF